MEHLRRSSYRAEWPAAPPRGILSRAARISRKYPAAGGEAHF
jgi:hypothetical protein